VAGLGGFDRQERAVWAWRFRFVKFYRARPFGRSVEPRSDSRKKPDQWKSSAERFPHIARAGAEKGERKKGHSSLIDVRPLVIFLKLSSG
jgi:hypothetical protein